MALLFFKVYPKSQSDRLIDGTELVTKNCYIEDDFLSEIYDVIGETKVVIYGDESGTDENQFSSITGEAIIQVKTKAELRIDALITTAANLIATGEDRTEYYSKIMHMTELWKILNIKIEFNLHNDFAVLQLEP